MSTRQPLRLPITLGILMIVLIVALTVGWVLLAMSGIQSGGSRRTALFVTLLSVGTTFLVIVLVGTVMYLALTIKAINLTRRQSNFVDSVTHELKSPIASLKLYLQTLSRRQVGEAERTEFYGSMLDDIERLDELINHLLDAARLEREAFGHEIEIVDLAELLADCAASVCLRYRVPPETIELDVEPATVSARRVDLDMVFRNLLDNAVKYAGTPPQVQVTAQRKPDRAVVRIRDNGSGIPKELRRKIFARFVRLGSELERKKPGTGLGLYIVRTLVRKMKGKIHVEAAHDPEGTVFEVTLPRGYNDPLSESVGTERKHR
jgi:signal transduction histidine kinase